MPANNADISECKKSILPDMFKKIYSYSKQPWNFICISTTSVTTTANEKNGMLSENVVHKELLCYNSIGELLVRGKLRMILHAIFALGWTRQGHPDYPGSGCAVVISNADGGEKKMQMGKAHAGKKNEMYCRQP